MMTDGQMMMNAGEDMAGQGETMMDNAHSMMHHAPAATMKGKLLASLPAPQHAATRATPVAEPDRHLLTIPTRGEPQ